MLESAVVAGDVGRRGTALSIGGAAAGAGASEVFAAGSNGEEIGTTSDGAGEFTGVGDAPSPERGRFSDGVGQSHKDLLASQASSRENAV